MTRPVSGRARASAGAGRTAAVVMGLGYGGLNVARSLWRFGVQVDGVHRNAGTPAARSRALTRLRVWSADAQGAEEGVDWLCALGDELGRPVLVLLDDRDALFVARHRERLERSFRYGFVPPELVTGLVDKAALHRLCEEHGAPTPRTTSAESVDEALAFARDVGYPLVAKGGAPFGDDPIAGTADVPDESALRALVARSLDRDVAPVLQERLPAGPSNSWIYHGYFDEQSRCLFGMTGVKLMQQPRHGGRTVLAESVPNPELIEHTARLFGALGYRGVLGCDFHFDPRDGTYKLLDANPRIGANFRLSVDAGGLDIVRTAYLDLTGDAASVGAPRVGRRWLQDGDFPASWDYVRARELTPGRWLGSLRGVDERAWFARDDVGPFRAFVRGKVPRLPRSRSK